MSNHDDQLRILKLVRDALQHYMVHLEELKSIGASVAPATVDAPKKAAKKTTPRHHWTADEETFVIQQRMNGKTNKEIAEAMGEGISEGQVKSKYESIMKAANSSGDEPQEKKKSKKRKAEDEDEDNESSTKRAKSDDAAAASDEDESA